MRYGPPVKGSKPGVAISKIFQKKTTIYDKKILSGAETNVVILNVNYALFRVFPGSACMSSINVGPLC